MLPWGIRLAVCGSMLVFWTGLSEVYAIPKMIALAAGTALAWAGLAMDPSRVRPTPLDKPLLAFLGASILSWSFSDDRFVGMVGKYSIYTYGLTAALLCAALYYAVAWSRETEKPEGLLSLCLAAGGAVGFYGLLQRAGIEPFPSVLRSYLEVGRVISTIGSPVTLGAVLLLFAPVSLHFAIKGDRLLGWLCGALVAGGLFFTLSRAAWLGALAGVCAYPFLAGRIRGARAKAGALILLVLLVIGALFVGSRVRKVGKSDSGRWELYLSVGRAFAEHPVLGTGPDTVQAAVRRCRTEGFVRVMGARASQVSAHNDFLQVLVTTGLLGLGAYLWLLWSIGKLVWDALRDEGRRPVAAAVGAALIGLFVQAKLNPTCFTAHALAAAFLGLLVPRGPVKRKVPCAAAAFLCVLAGAFFIRLAAADMHFKTARKLKASGMQIQALKEHRAAVALNPRELFYRMILARHLYFLSEKAGGLPFLEEAAAVAAEGAAMRPGDADGHVMLGTYLLALKAAGGPDRLPEAKAALDRAAAMDPYFLPLLENRVQLAALTGDMDSARSLKAELDRVNALASGAKTPPDDTNHE